MAERLALTRIFLCAAICVLLTTATFALSTPERNGWVTDQAGILDTDTSGAIAAKLIDLQRKTGDEVVVVTLSSLQGASIETWGDLLGESWAIGKSGGQDTGVLLIVAPNERKVRISVGYGLGNRIPDSVAAAIISDHILPYFRQGDLIGGVKAGVASIVVQLDRVSGTTAAPNSTDVERGAYSVPAYQPSFWRWLRYKLTRGYHDDKMIVFFVVLFVVVFIWMVLNVGNVGSGRRRRRWNDYDDGYGSSGSSCGSSWSSSSSSPSDSGSSGGGSSSGGATGSW